MNSKPCGRVGYWLSEKKGRKFNLSEMAEVFRASGLELIKLDFTQSLEEQGPFDAIVHKMSDIIVRADEGDEKAKEIIKSFQEYVDAHPNIVVIDSIFNIRKLLDRYHQYKLVAESNLCKQGFVFIPPFVEMTTTNVSENLIKMKEAGIDFPIVCKPSLAHGAPLSHKMCLIFNEEGLKDVSPPCIVQKIINHNAVLYKLLIIGNVYFLIERPSLKNLYASEQKTIYFDSNDISKPHSACELTELDDNEPYSPVMFPEKEKMDKIVESLHDSIGLNLLNIDVIVDNATARYAIVDINVFPGYPDVHNFYELLCDLVSSKIQQKISGIEPTYQPVLLDCLSSPILRIKREKQKFTFDMPDMFKKQGSDSFTDSQVPKCFCCPISGVCSNSANHFHNSTNLTEQQIMHLNSSGELITFNKQNAAQEDSGIETSDSCDEKRKEACHKIKYQHSKFVPSFCTTVSESG